MRCHADATLILTGLALVFAAGFPVAAGLIRAGGSVELVSPFERATAPAPPSLSGFKFANLAKIDPDEPLADKSANQTLSLFGREDLIAASSADYKATACAPLASSADVLAEIEKAARLTTIVIINESHERSQHRGFTAEVARRLRPLGYDVLAMEALSNPEPETPAQFLPLYLSQPGLPYLADDDGYYTSEAGFGRLGRQAKALGYRLVPYEAGHDKRTETMTADEQIAVREEAQARNLASFIREHPDAKLLIHVGYSHAGEVPHTDGNRWMAARLKEKTGIDPLTISQTTCRGGGALRRLSILPADETKGRFDLVVDHPAARFERHRPEWRRQAGDHAVNIPRALRPAKGWRVIEARPEGEPVAAVPTDRVAIRPGEDVALMLPAGRYHLRVIDVGTNAKASSKARKKGDNRSAR